MLQDAAISAEAFVTGLVVLVSQAACNARCVLSECGKFGTNKDGLVQDLAVHENAAVAMQLQSQQSNGHFS